MHIDLAKGCLRALHRYRDEDPVGEWTIRVSDQRKETMHGVFLGWTMSVFGSVQDESKPYKTFELQLVEDVLPPESTTVTAPSSTSEVPTSTSTKTLPKPTDHLPDDHGEAEGEAHMPAFPGNTSSNSTAASPTSAVGAADSTMPPTADEGWFSDLSNLVSNQVWFFVALGVVVLFGAGAGFFFWQRAVRRRRANANYTSLAADDEMGMRSLSKPARGGTQRTKDLYDAFGEVEDDDEDADESTGLRPHVHSPGVEMGLHSGFLDDDEPSTGGSAIGRYRDEPVEAPQPTQQRADSPGSGSGSSWEHAT